MAVCYYLCACKFAPVWECKVIRLESAALFFQNRDFRYLLCSKSERAFSFLLEFDLSEQLMIAAGFYFLLMKRFFFFSKANHFGTFCRRCL